jgi:hypothetical protein
LGTKPVGKWVGQARYGSPTLPLLCLTVSDGVSSLCVLKGRENFLEIPASTQALLTVSFITSAEWKNRCFMTGNRATLPQTQVKLKILSQIQHAFNPPNLA